MQSQLGRAGYPARRSQRSAFRQPGQRAWCRSMQVPLACLNSGSSSSTSCSSAVAIMAARPGGAVVADRRARAPQPDRPPRVTLCRGAARPDRTGTPCAEPLCGRWRRPASASTGNGRHSDQAETNGVDQSAHSCRDSTSAIGRSARPERRGPGESRYVYLTDLRRIISTKHFPLVCS